MLPPQVSKRPFCTSAHQAVRLLATNLASAATIRFVAALFLLLGKVLVGASCAAVSALYMATHEPYQSQLYSLATPVAAIAVASFGVSSPYTYTYTYIYIHLYR